MLLVTPVNKSEAWEEFRKNKYKAAPTFHYRLMPIDVDQLKRKLYNIPIEKIDDPTLGFLFRDKRHELGKMLTMLVDRNTPDFMNGEALQHKGKYCAIRRVNSKDDIRSNIHAGGSVQQANVDQTMLNLVELVQPKLVQDGMFLVGLDIVGNKLMEINVFSPGALPDASEMEGVDFSKPVIAALERKVHYKKTYGGQIDNKTVAMI
ncbi:tyrosine/phenylalanine carboxypeptidase domain-containing protein [Pontibacter silvestris]|uniref:Tyrosine/phenylalanine carboxypeptidase domain-containing protein n=1 Tax=Pontibacter silvestris TaxID=2305183 RepID=A0ABW4WX88_9BACT|nr:tyrosine/phenylalanine carboxypeptidase domain-containing protein [Pontibacter silvestris]MCC9138516.1 DUF1704 domain-containing protein [Pontibacter silvestris]